MIHESIERPSAEIVQGFRNLLCYDSITCGISDCMGRFNAMTSDMRPLFEGIRLVGTAVTVKTLASDLAAAFKAIDICKHGDIVVIDSHESINTALGTTPLQITGNLILRISSTSRHAPSITAAITPRLSADIVMFSPQKVILKDGGQWRSVCACAPRGDLADAGEGYFLG